MTVLRYSSYIKRESRIRGFTRKIQSSGEFQQRRPWRQTESPIAELFRLDAESGAVGARLSVGTAEFRVADESPEHLNFSPESLGGGSVRMVMTMEDPDAVFDRAVAAGAAVVCQSATSRGSAWDAFVDPFGHH